MLTELLKKASQPPHEARPTRSDADLPTLSAAQSAATITSPTIKITADDLPETEVTKKPDNSLPCVSDPIPRIPTHTSRDMHMSYSRLPKLHLPTFDGNPLQWQTFWDSFSAAVDSNACLTGVKKFNYLRTQL